MTAAATSSVNERYEQFQAETARIPFVKIPKAVLEATMHDRLATIWQRVFAYIIRYSWGNYSFYAVNDDGTPRLQRDCAKELDIPKQAVSKVVRYGITRGYLQDELKILYPLLAPQLTNCKKVAPLGDFSWATFWDQWKVANSTDFLQLEVARSTVKRIQKVALSDFKKWRASGTNGAPSLYKDLEIVKREESVVVDSSGVEVEANMTTTPPPEPPMQEPAPEMENPSHEEPEPVGVPRDPQLGYVAGQIGIDRGAAKRLLQETKAVQPDATAQEIVEAVLWKLEQVRGQIKSGKITNWVGFMITAIPQMAQSVELWTEIQARARYRPPPFGD